MLLAYSAGYPGKRKIRMIKRVRKGYMHKFVTSLNAIYIFKNIFKKKKDIKVKMALESALKIIWTFSTF